MKTWTVLFLLVLAAGVAWGLARDVFSRQRAILQGVIVGSDSAAAPPKSPPPSPPRYKVRLSDGRLVDVATTGPLKLNAGAEITVTEWMTPWGQVWYTQRD